MKKKRFTKLLALLLAVMMVFALPMEAGAARKVTAKANWKKATVVKKGTTTVTAKDVSKYLTYVKFTAPKKGTYKITFSNLRKPGSSSSKDIIHASAFLYKVSSGYLQYVTVKQNGDEVTSLGLCSKYSQSLSSSKKITSSTDINSRTASIKLKKGETIYIGFLFSAINSKKCLYDLKISKK